MAINGWTVLLASISASANVCWINRLLFFAIMASQALNGTSLALSVASMAFFIVGAIAYTDQQIAIENTAWIYFNKAGTESYYGLHTVFTKFKFDEIDYKGTLSYDESACNLHGCDVCNKAGRSAFGLTILAAIFSAITLSLSGVSLASYNKGLQIANVVMAFLSAAFSLIAIGLFMSWCFDALEDNVNTDDDGTSYGYDDDGYSRSIDLKWGNGSILTTLGMLLMWVVVILQIAAAIVGGNSIPVPNSPAPVQDAVVAM